MYRKVKSMIVNFVKFELMLTVALNRINDIFGYKNYRNDFMNDYESQKYLEVITHNWLLHCSFRSVLLLYGIFNCGKADNYYIVPQLEVLQSKSSICVT